MPDFGMFIAANSDIFLIISWLILSVGLLQNFIYLIQLPAAWMELREYSQAQDTESAWQMLISGVTMPITIIVPAYNEEVTIVQSAMSMLSLEYPDLNLIIVNDGSSDKTVATLIEAFEMKKVTHAYEEAVKHEKIIAFYKSPLHPNMLLIDKSNGGKADAINAGINASRTPLFCVVDADSIMETQSLLRSVRPFMEHPNKTIAVGGTIRVANGCVIKNGRIKEVKLPTTFIPLVQTMEYIRSFLMSRLAWSRWGVLTIISGAFGIFKRDIAVKVGGFSHNTVGEDLEIILKMHEYMRENKKDYIMRYVPEPVCWTEAPEDLNSLSKQRRRWQRGALEGFFMHKKMFMNPRYGRIGTIGFLHSLLVDVISPITEVIGYLLIPLFYFSGVLDKDFLLAFIALFFIFGVMISVSSLILEEIELKRFPKARDLFILAFIAIIENFGYRQLCNFWRVQGWLEFIFRKKTWDKFERKGFSIK